MKTRSISAARAVAFVIATAALFLASSAVRAQAPNCAACDHFSVGVSPNLGCAVTVCYTHSPEGPVFCTTIRPARRASFPCGVYQAWVETCSGPYYLIPANADVLCSGLLKFAAGCCGKICHVPNPDEDCTLLEVQPLACVSDKCP